MLPQVEGLLGRRGVLETSLGGAVSRERELHDRDAGLGQGRREVAGPGPISLPGDAMGDDDHVLLPWPARDESVVQPLATRIADLAGRGHCASMRAINRSTASPTKAGSSAWVLRSTTARVVGTLAFSSAKNAASLTGSWSGPPGFA